ncbi:MAG: PAS domain S-box protein [Euryarchaeota archaeon]|nr:PAS domain S-box protein [Euryarchaeota archaeon]
MAKKARILIVEDEAIVAEDLEMVVTNVGYEVVGRAASADEAVKKAVSLMPDLILMDIVLIGHKNGIDASHEIKEKTDIPVIFLTAYTDLWLIEKAKSTEPYAYLVKPFQERQLFASIEMGLYKCRAEMQLKASEEMYHLLADNTADCIWLMNLDFEFKYVNPSVLQMVGFTPEEWVGSSLYEHCSPEDMAFCLNAAKEGLKKGQEASGVTFEMQLWHKNGEKIDVEIATKILFDAAGNPVGIQGATRDITERKRAEERVKAAYRLREHFLKETSHQIITPVAIIGGYTDLLEESADLDDQQKEYLRIIRERNKEIQELVTDALAGKYLKEYVE